MAQFQNNFTEMFLSCPFTKIANMIRSALFVTHSAAFDTATGS